MEDKRRYYVRLVDLAANALIAVKRRGLDITFFSFAKLEEYGAKIVEMLKLKEKEVVLMLSRDWTEQFFDEYSDFFQPRQENGENGVAFVNMDVTLDTLVRKFQGYLPLDLLKAFISDDSLQTLGLATA